MERLGGGGLRFSGLPGGAEGDATVSLIEKFRLPGVWGEAQISGGPSGSRLHRREIRAHFGCTDRGR